MQKLLGFFISFSSFSVSCYARGRKEKSFQASSEALLTSYGVPLAEPLISYSGSDSESSGSSDTLTGYDISDASEEMLLESVPGVPNIDYPVLAYVPQTEFSCQGKVSGGKASFKNICYGLNRLQPLFIPLITKLS